MRTFAEQAIAFNRILADMTQLPELPEGIQFMNPFSEARIFAVAADFYGKFYDDDCLRHLILGINPGRHGAGATGVPFTDSKRLVQLGIAPRGLKTHEPSSVFVYQVIAAYGGAVCFYKDFYISSLCPLGLIRKNSRGRWVNCNYYDGAVIKKAVLPLIGSGMAQLLTLPVYTDRVFCLGQDKNFTMLKELNQQYGWFGEVIALPHPRYIAQYRQKYLQQYIEQYLSALRR